MQKPLNVAGKQNNATYAYTPKHKVMHEYLHCRKNLVLSAVYREQHSEANAHKTATNVTINQIIFQCERLYRKGVGMGEKRKKERNDGRGFRTRKGAESKDVFVDMGARLDTCLQPGTDSACFLKWQCICFYSWCHAAFRRASFRHLSLELKIEDNYII